MTVTTSEVERFRRIVAQRIGLSFGHDRVSDLEGLLRDRLRSRHMTADQYLAAIDPPEIGVIAERLTVGETYFFRYREQFEALSQDVVPQLHGERPLQVLSIGCATGDEPYSIAIELRERTSRDFEIRAFDVNPAAISRADKAHYSAWALRETSDERRARYFGERNAGFQLVREIRAAVALETRNLLCDDVAFWRPDALDVVFCRNVIMYFEPETMRSVVRRIARSIRPAGYLFLGHAETLRGLSDDFELCHTHGTFYYRRIATDDRAASNAPWPDAIREAAKRVALLTDAAAPPQSPRVFEEEGIEDALERALALTNEGKVDEAERACRRLIAAGKRDARLHYLIALCREHAGDRAGALEHDRAAARLDDRFVMPHLHQGLLERRAGHHGRAAAALTRALDRLALDEPTRLAAFGGGFSRESLALLCRQELARCKDRR